MVTGSNPVSPTSITAGQRDFGPNRTCCVQHMCNSVALLTHGTAAVQQWRVLHGRQTAALITAGRERPTCRVGN
jgi:hypothetical protein